jgi:ribonuclease HI
MITQQRPPIVTLQPRWWPPAGCLKINFDGAFAQETNVGAWGFIVRNHEGQPVLAGARNLVMTHNAPLAESYACKYALEAAAYLGLSRIVLETAK